MKRSSPIVNSSHSSYLVHQESLVNEWTNMEAKTDAFESVTASASDDDPIGQTVESETMDLIVDRVREHLSSVFCLQI